MKKIVVESMPIRYFFKQEKLLDEVCDLVNIKSEYYRFVWHKYLAHNQDVFRLAAIKSKLFGNEYIFHMLWLEKTNLEQLDVNVRDNAHSDNDFNHTILSNFSKLECRECGWSGHGFIFVPVEPYAGFRTLEDKKLKMLKKHKSIKCPKCNQSLRRIVLKILEPLSN